MADDCIIQPDNLALSGELDRDLVAQIWPKIKAWKTNAAELECNLQKVTRIDSAGMVMLIHLIEHAKKQNCHIMLSFVPAQLSMLFQLSNVEHLLDGHIKDISEVDCG